MSEMKDITDVILQQTDLPRDIEPVRRKCLQLPMVSECEAVLSMFKGRPLGDGRYEVDVAGSLNVRTRMQVGVKFDAEGVAEIDSAGQHLLIKDVRILNDFHSLFGKVLEMSGLANGKKVKLRAKDSVLIRASLAA